MNYIPRAITPLVIEYSAEVKRIGVVYDGDTTPPIALNIRDI